MTPSPELERLRVRVRELEEELEEWRREDWNDDQDDRIPLLRNALKLRAQACKAVLMLCEQPGKFVSRARLHEAIALESETYNLVNVAFCHARRAFDKKGIGREQIVSAWGHGYMITPEGARQVRALVEQ